MQGAPLPQWVQLRRFGEPGIPPCTQAPLSSHPQLCTHLCQLAVTDGAGPPVTFLLLVWKLQVFSVVQWTSHSFPGGQMSLAVNLKQKSDCSSGDGCKQISWTMFAGNGVPQASHLNPSGLPKLQVQATLPYPFLLVFLLVTSSSIPSEGRKSLKA